jgi:hypothetical protein
MGKKRFLRAKRAELSSIEGNVESLVDQQLDLSGTQKGEKETADEDRPPVDCLHEEVADIFMDHQDGSSAVLAQTRCGLRNPVPSTGDEDESPQLRSPTRLALNAIGAKPRQGIKVQITPYRKIKE